MKRLFLVCAGALALGALLAMAAIAKARGGERGKGGKPDAAPVPVKAALAASKAVPLELGGFGTAEANATVSIRAQVTGVIEKVRFKEGQTVTGGGGRDPETGKETKPTPLFTIDERPFRAELERVSAQLKNAQRDYDRQKKLFDAGGTTESTYQQAEANLDVLKAAAKTAALNVEYCTIDSPIDGRTGACLVDAGNMVKSGEAVLVVVNQVKPIQVSFAVPQQSLAEIKKRMAAGALKVSASAPGAAAPETGTLFFVDNTVDPSTGTVKLKAVFDNKDEGLWPGQFVSVKVILHVQPDAVVIPSKAIQSGQGGLYIFAIAPDGKADKRTVTVDREIDGESVISSGNVKPGEQVVTDGQLRILNGTPVEILKDAGGPEPGKAPAPAPAKGRPEKSGGQAGGAPRA